MMVAWNLGGSCGMQRCGWISYDCLDLQRDRIRGQWVPTGPRHGTVHSGASYGAFEW